MDNDNHSIVSTILFELQESNAQSLIGPSSEEVRDLILDYIMDSNFFPFLALQKYSHVFWQEDGTLNVMCCCLLHNSA